MKNKGLSIMIGVAAFLAGAAGTALALGSSQPDSDPTRAKIEKIVREYILANPEIIPEAMQRLQQRETASAVGNYRARIEKPFAGAWAGNPNGTATLAIFFDYACGYCRASLPDIERLLREDKQLRIVFRELPILSEDSEKAARMSLAAAEQGKFKAFHDTLYAAGRPTAETITRVAKSVGVDPAASAASPAIQREIEQNVEIARALRFTGTPSWVVGDQVLNGAVGYDALKAAIAEARKSGR